MPGEQRSDKRRRPQGIREPQQQRKQQRGVGRVEQHVDEMMRAGIGAEQFAIQHVREPGERMPVRRVETRERPAEAVPRQAGQHGMIFGDVFLVVEIHEAVMHDRQINHQRGEREQQGDEART